MICKKSDTCHVPIKIVKAVTPYQHSGFMNFKTAPYEAWVRNVNESLTPTSSPEGEGSENGKGNVNVNDNVNGVERMRGITKAQYPPRLLHGLAYRWELPTLWKSKSEARLRFVEPVSLSFDTFPDYARYEIIPMVWDCWPCYFEKMCRWIKKHNVRTAIFMSSQTAVRIQKRFPEMNVMWCPEAVDASLYHEGKLLKERTIDVLEFGRSSNVNVNGKFNYVCTKVDGKFIFNNEQLHDAMENARITIALPRSMTQPDVAGDIETLTQRYWENMLSRIVMVGHAPKELVDMIGYNPVLELDKEHPNEQILGILAHIEDFQSLVDRNRDTALKMGDWTLRMKEVMAWLHECGYEV